MIPFEHLGYDEEPYIGSFTKYTPMDDLEDEVTPFERGVDDHIGCRCRDENPYHEVWGAVQREAWFAGWDTAEALEEGFDKALTH